MLDRQEGQGLRTITREQVLGSLLGGRLGISVIHWKGRICAVGTFRRNKAEWQKEHEKAFERANNGSDNISTAAMAAVSGYVIPVITKKKAYAPNVLPGRIYGWPKPERMP